MNHWARRFYEFAANCFAKTHRIPNQYIAKSLFRSFLLDYKRKVYPIWKTFVIHRRGFTVMDWSILDLDNHEYKRYLSTEQYYRMHPLNGENSSIIDSKLALKDHCADTPINQFMPKYYFRITDSGKLCALYDYCHDQNVTPDWNDVLRLLEKEKCVAVKRNAGSIGAGFYRCEYSDGNYYANGLLLDDPRGFFSNLREYLITEFLKPHEEIARICPSTANAIRYLAGRIDNQLVFLKGFIRFGTKDSGFVENYNMGGILCYLDADGYFRYGNQIDPVLKKNLTVNTHPDSGMPLTGRIPLWDQIVSAVNQFGDQFPQLDYLGFDFVVTSDSKIKILEINSLTSLDALQLDRSIMETDASEFFRERI